jgi:hypothetical protein
MDNDLEPVKDRILEAAKSSALGKTARVIEIEADCDDDGAEFIRVVLQVKPGDNVQDADYEALLERIENAVGAIDDRYASVRFLDAA